MILAHHAGEELIVSAAAGGAGAVSIVILVARARISRLAQCLRRLGRPRG